MVTLSQKQPSERLCSLILSLVAGWYAPSDPSTLSALCSSETPKEAGAGQGGESMGSQRQPLPLKAHDHPCLCTPPHPFLPKHPTYPRGREPRLGGRGRKLQSQSPSRQQPPLVDSLLSRFIWVVNSTESGRGSPLGASVRLTEAGKVLCQSR